MIWADSRSNGDAEPRPYPKSSTLCWPWHVQISVSGYKNNNIYKPYSFCPRCAFLHCEHSRTIPKHPNSSIWDGTSTVITCKYLQQDSSDVKAKNPWPWWHWIPCWCSWLWACNLETLEKTRKELVAMKNMLKVQPVRDSSMRRLTSFRFRQVSAARGFLSSKTRSSQFWPNWVALGKSTSTRSKEVRHSKWRKILQYCIFGSFTGLWVWDVGYFENICRSILIATGWCRWELLGQNCLLRLFAVFFFLICLALRKAWGSEMNGVDRLCFAVSQKRLLLCCFGMFWILKSVRWLCRNDSLQKNHDPITDFLLPIHACRNQARVGKPIWWPARWAAGLKLDCFGRSFFFSDTSSVLKCWHRRLGWIVGGALWPLGIFVRIYTYTSSAARGGAGSFKKVMYI